MEAFGRIVEATYVADGVDKRFRPDLDVRPVFYLQISAGHGGGPVIDRSYHRGAAGRSGEIGLMPDPTAKRQGAPVQDTVSLSALLARLEDAEFGDVAVVDLMTLGDTAEPVLALRVDDSVRARSRCRWWR